MKEEFKSAEDVQKWLSEDRNVPAPVAAAVAPTLFEGGYLYPSSLLNIQRQDLDLLSITPPHRNTLFNKLQQQTDLPDGIKRVVAFVDRSMESINDKKDMPKASSEWARELVAALGIIACTLDGIPNGIMNMAEPAAYLWKVMSLTGEDVPLTEHKGTPGARKWFHNHFLSGDDLEKAGYTFVVTTVHKLPTLKAGGKTSNGKGDMVIGKKVSMDLGDNVYEQAPGLIELKTKEYPIKVGRIILEITAFSRISRFG